MTRNAAASPVTGARGTGRLPRNAVVAPSLRRKLHLLLAVGGVCLAFPAPVAGQGTWTPTGTTGAPTARKSHTAVWAGSQMIVWGGYDVSPADVSTGGVYDPATDAWTPTTTTGAPTARDSHTAVWTGSRMIVWGGWSSNNVPLDTGGIYDPATDTWSSMSASGAPVARVWHTAVWTGSKMIVWGGMNLSTHTYINTGGLYDPATDSWAAVSTVGAPSARRFHTAIWTGSRMIVWGGFGDAGFANTGGVYDPATNTWTATSTTGAPDARMDHTSVWTGTRMVVWGGMGAGDWITTGGIYDPVANAWTGLVSGGAPAMRRLHTAVWTGSRMVIWGGSDVLMTAYYNTGGVYDPATDTWVATPDPGAPTARAEHTSVWTGSRMIVWGGESDRSGTLYGTGGIYDNPSAFPSPTAFYTVTPCRLADTRSVVGPTGGPALAPSTTRRFPVTGGACGIPSAAGAVSVNLTAVGAASAGYLTLYPGNSVSAPLVSNVNFTAGVTRANNAILPLATDGTGTINVKNGSVGPVHFVLDVNGYFQ
jgi:N-acetylneuraminic acid mutarotase